MGILSLFFLATIAALFSHGSHVAGQNCESRRLGIETHNIVGFTSFAKDCREYLSQYMQSPQYHEDLKTVANEALVYAKSLKVAQDGKDVWIFDVDETALSTLPYFLDLQFSQKAYNGTRIFEWVSRGIAPPLKENLELYNDLMCLGYKVIFMTGRSEDKRPVTVANLNKAGYCNWEKLILRGPTDANTSAITYKSLERERLEKSGYRIVGNIGDQWSDILGTHVGSRTFKVPNPMYYLA